MREAGALQRRRAIRSASDLLRLCFGFVLGRFSLRMLASWASTEGVADLSDVAALKRLRASADWLGLLAARLLRARYPEVAAGARDQHRLVAVDATMVVPPGDKRDYWLVHTVFDLHDLTFRVVETSDRFERERLTRGGVRPGEVRIADRFHARAEELAAVRAEDAHFLVRAASTYPRLLGSNGKRLDRAALLAEADQAGSLDRPVTVASAKSKTRVAARLVIVPHPRPPRERASRPSGTREPPATRPPRPGLRLRAISCSSPRSTRTNGRPTGSSPPTAFAGRWNSPSSGSSPLSGWRICAPATPIWREPGSIRRFSPPSSPKTSGRTSIQRRRTLSPNVPRSPRRLPIWRIVRLAVLRLTLVTLASLQSPRPSPAAIRRLTEPPRQRQSRAHRMIS